VQLEAGASVEGYGQSVSSADHENSDNIEKSPIFAPVIVELDIVRGIFPVLFNVTGVAETAGPPTTPFPKFTLVGDTLSAGVGIIDSPRMFIDCGLPAASSENVMTAVLDPVVTGENRTVTVQLPPAATVPTHVSLFEKLRAIHPGQCDAGDIEWRRAGISNHECLG